MQKKDLIVNKEFIQNSYCDYNSEKLAPKNKIVKELDETFIPEVERILASFENIEIIKFKQGLSFLYPCNTWYIILWRNLTMTIELCDKRFKIMVRKGTKLEDTVKFDGLTLSNFQDWLTIDKLESKLERFMKLF